MYKLVVLLRMLAKHLRIGKGGLCSHSRMNVSIIHVHVHDIAYFNSLTKLQKFTDLRPVHKVLESGLAVD